LVIPDDHFEEIQQNSCTFFMNCLSSGLTFFSCMRDPWTPRRQHRFTQRWCTCRVVVLLCWCRE